MSEHDFRQPMTVDQAPFGSRCAWCGKPAVQQLTTSGGHDHNDGGCFCSSCGEQYALTVADSLSRVITTDTVEDMQYSKR